MKFKIKKQKLSYYNINKIFQRVKENEIELVVLESSDSDNKEIEDNKNDVKEKYNVIELFSDSD